MRGVIFTEFLEMVEESYGIETAERVVGACDLASGGAYTSVGTYDHHELLAMVGVLASQSGTPPSALVKAFGKHLFKKFTVDFRELFEGLHDAFEFLAQVDDRIHVEVRKLYPDAELPRFDVRRLDADRLEMIYRSSRPFSDLAEGLIEGCVDHYGAEIEVRREELADGSVRFLMAQKTGAAV